MTDIKARLALPAVQPGHVNETPKSEHDERVMLTLTAERDLLRALLAEADRRIAWEAHGFGNDFAERVEAALKGDTP